MHEQRTTTPTEQVKVSLPHNGESRIKYHTAITGQEIRIVVCDGKPWFCIADILKSAGVRYQQNILNKLPIGESRLFVYGLRSMRYVSKVGLLLILPQKPEYKLALMDIVDLIEVFRESNIHREISKYLTGKLKKWDDKNSL